MNLTIKDIAKLADVSTTTVSKYLNKHPYVSKEKAEKIGKVIKELNYAPSNIARSLKSKKNKIIGLIGGFTLSPIHEGIMKCINNYLDKNDNRDYKVLYFSLGNRFEFLESYLDFLIENRVSGVLMTFDKISENHLNTLASHNISLVFVTTQTYKKYSFVSVDDAKGTKIALEYLIKLGHRLIGYISASDSDTTLAKERLKGYKLALESNKLEFKPEYIYGGFFDINTGYEGAKQLLSLKEKPSVIVCVNDITAIGVLKYCNLNNIKVPDQLVSCHACNVVI